MPLNIRRWWFPATSIALVVLWAGVVALPIGTLLTRALTVAAPLALAVVLTVRCWHRRWLRWLPSAVVVVGALGIALPGGPHDRERLRARYLASLRRYEGTRYVWGGENRLGIDCSGLVRNGLINAMAAEGLRSAKAALLRASMRLWWYDCTARALRDGYRAWTRPVLRAAAVRALAVEALRPGDLAVTADGIHVMAYLGGDEWIEADPGLRRVTRLHQDDDNPWLRVPVVVMRWTAL